MKNIILAAGYATRLYPLTENFPKPLLKVGDSSILERLIADIDTINEVDEHIIVTNHKFVSFFSSVHSTKKVTVVDDGSTTNENRLGAVKDLLLAIAQCAINEDIMVVAADNLLDFSLQGFVDFFRAKGASCIMCHEEPSLSALQRTGVIAVDEHFKVLQMQEKPQQPVSHWAVPPFYLYSAKDLPLIRTAMQRGCGFDAPGNLAHFLVENATVYAYRMPGTRFDIGSLEAYERAKQLFFR